MGTAISPAELQRRERAYREQTVTHTGNRRVRYQWRVELEAVMARLHAQPGMRVLDAGCGVGRISCAALRRGAQVVCVDFALSRLRYLRTQAPTHSRPQPCQADLNRLPLAAGAFDAVLCTQVLEHIPEPAARRRLLAHLACLLRPAGRLLLTVYNFSEPWQRRGKPQEGLHDSGIFFHCYRTEELRQELAPHFEVLELCGLIHLLPHTWRWFPLLGPLARGFDHHLERNSAWSCQWGHLLFAHARVNS